MDANDIEALVQQLKSITNCLYGNVSADADSVCGRLDEIARLARLGAAIEAMPRYHSLRRDTLDGEHDVWIVNDEHNCDHPEADTPAEALSEK